GRERDLDAMPPGVVRRARDRAGHDLPRPHERIGSRADRLTARTGNQRARAQRRDADDRHRRDSPAQPAEYGTEEATCLATVGRPSRPPLVSLSVKKLLILAVALVVVFAHDRAHAAATGACGLPDTKPLWVDYAEGSVGF